MAQFKFEGDNELLADPQIKLVESVLQKQGFTKENVVVEPVGQTGDNYVAHVKRFIYEAEDGSTFKMIGKIAPIGEQLRMMMKTMLLFNNEMSMYNSVLPKFNDLQNLADITDSEKIRFPACYGVVTEEPYEFILLEDLKEAGFEMLDRLKPLTNKSVRLVLKELAKYHSLSYAWKNSEPEIFEEYSNKLCNVWAEMHAEPESAQFLEMAEEDLIKLMHDEDGKYKNVVKGSLTQIVPMSKELESYERISKHSVIQHGDCWINNILFRLENGKPVQDDQLTDHLIMIDYQLSRKNNPVTDLLYFIFNCTDHVTRLKHYQEWIDYYHESLNYSLSLHGIEANRILPKDQLDTNLRRYGKLMVGVGIFLTSLLMKESKDITFDMKEFTGDKDQLLENAMQVNATMSESTLINVKERIMGIVDSALEFGLI